MPLDFPELGILREDTKRGEGGDDEAGQSVKKSSLQEVAPEEAKGGPEEKVAQPVASAFLVLANGRDGREPVEGGHLVADVRVGVVIQRISKAFDPTIHGCAVMRLLPATLSFIFAEETELGVGIPVAVRDPATEVAHEAGELVAGKIARISISEFGNDLIAQAGRNLLVGIQKQNPGTGCQVLDEVFLTDIPEPLVLINCPPPRFRRPRLRFRDSAECWALRYRQ